MKTRTYKKQDRSGLTPKALSELTEKVMKGSEMKFHFLKIENEIKSLKEMDDLYFLNRSIFLAFFDGNRASVLGFQTILLAMVKTSLASNFSSSIFNHLIVIPRS